MWLSIHDLLAMLGVVSLTFHELSKIFSRKLCIAKIVLVIRISSWNFVRVPKALLWAHVQSFRLTFLPQMWFLVLCIFARFFWRARETLVKWFRCFYFHPYTVHPPSISYQFCTLNYGPFCNTLRPKRNVCHFTDSILKCVFLDKTYEFRLRHHWSLFIRIQLTITPALVQIMAWRRPGNKPLSETFVVSSLAHICVAQPQWVNFLVIIFTYQYQF